MACALRAAAQPGVPADQGPADPRGWPGRPRPAAGDDRRHHPDAADAGADPRAACGRAAPGGGQFRPAHRNQDQGRTGRTRRAVQPHGRRDAGILHQARAESRRADRGSGPVGARAESAGRSRPRGRILARPQIGAGDGRQRAQPKSPAPMPSSSTATTPAGGRSNSPSRSASTRTGTARDRASRHRRGRKRARPGRRKRPADRHLRSRRGARPSAECRRSRCRLQFGAGGAAGRPAGHSRLAGGAAQNARRMGSEHDRADADIRAPVGAGNAQRPPVP